MHRAITGLVAGCLTSVCFAQEDAVVVTAPRFDEDVRRLPASVTVINAEDIAKSSARTIPELLSEQVGFTQKDLFGNNAAGAAVDLRGFGQTGPQNTLILLDGRRLNDFDLSGVQWSSIPVSSIERIEIMRGTGAVLYGDNASAGVVNIVSKSPLKTGLHGEAFGRVASFRTREGQIFASAGSDTFGINGSIYGYASDGYRQNNRNEQQNGTVNARWALSSAGVLDLRFGVDRQELRLPGARRVQPSIGLDEYASDPRGAQTPLDYASRDGNRYGLTWKQRFGEAEFTVGLDHRDKDQRSYFDQSGFPTYRADDLSLNSFTPRVRLPLEAAGMRHSLVLGVDVNRWRFDSRRADVPQNISQPANRVTVTQETLGYYAQDTIDLTRATLLTLGYRGERAKYSGEDLADPTSPACFFCAAAPSVRETQRQHAWEVGLRQALDAQHALFGRVGRSYRFVNAEEIYENDINFAPQFQVLAPQHAITYEGGAEWRARGNALRVTLFRTNVSDEIHLDPFTTGVGNTNLPPSRRQGAELDGRWQATPKLRFTGGYAYTDAKFLEGTLAGSPFAIGTGMPISGRSVPLVPRHKVNLGLSWDVLARTRFSAALTAASSQFMDNDEPNTLGTKIPAYHVVDMKLAQEFGWGRVAAVVNNLFNEKYYTYAVRSAFVADRYAVYPLPGTAFGLTVEVRM